MLQILTGTSPLTITLANLAWDLLQYMVPCMGIVLLMWWYGLPQFSGDRLEAIAVLLAALGLSGLPATYFFQMLFQVCACV